MKIEKTENPKILLAKRIQIDMYSYIEEKQKEEITRYVPLYGNLSFQFKKQKHAERFFEAVNKESDNMLTNNNFLRDLEDLCYLVGLNYIPINKFNPKFKKISTVPKSYMGAPKFGEWKK